MEPKLHSHKTQVPLRDSKLADPSVTTSVVDSNISLSKKAQFKKYILKSGFKHAIIRAIVALYENSQKPDDPLSWILGFIGHGIPSLQILENHQIEAKALYTKIEKLQQENSELKEKIEIQEAALQPDPMAEYDWVQLIADAMTDEEDLANISNK